MKLVILLLFALAGLSLGQSLPYQYAYTNERGWKEVMVFEQSPDNPDVILISLYSYVDAQVPYWKLKEKKPAGDVKQTLAFIAQCQANERATAQAVASSQAAVQSVKDHYADQQAARQRQAEESRAMWAERETERRLKALENAEKERPDANGVIRR